MPSRVEISINAQDNASATLDSVRNKLVLFDQFGRQASDLTQKFQGVDRSASGIDVSASKAARGIRAPVGPMAGELSPALGQLGGQITGVLITAGELSLRSAGASGA